MKHFIHLALFFSIMANLVLPIYQVQASVEYQSTTEQEKAQLLLEKMTPEERVGQLFLVTYQGADTGSETSIAKLIKDQHIGGVVLRVDNDNFAVSEGLPAAVKSTLRNLQVTNWQTSLAGGVSATGETQSPSNFIPLFVGISQEGDLEPNDQIINGLTPLPSAMAIGATWKPDNAEAVGKVLGSELSTLGFNFLLGPSLDVLDLVRTDVGDDLGVRTFGGDPYWVGQMGKAYIKGVHEGSSSKILVISKHFPGRGGSDRLPEDEVATVRKSLEQLKQIELYPFFTVTQGVTDPLEMTDGLLLSHIRYQGFQGNIRATTRPVSFDATALEQLLALDQFVAWRQQGGLIVSDDLGSAAVRKFFAPLDSNFDARQVSKAALQAGNDLLYLGNILSSGDDSTYTTVVKIYEYFVQKYKEDPVFQQQVDYAVLRILIQKNKLYPQFTISSLSSPDSELALVGTSQQVTFEIARQAVTLVSPSVQDLNADLPNPPQKDDKLVFVSNIIPQSQCSTCIDQSVFLAEELKNAVLRLYGPAAGDLVQEENVSAYSFENLKALLNGVDDGSRLISDLESANWIIIGFTELKLNSEESIAFQRLFSEKPTLTRDKKIIGFAFNAPYYPDATDISKFTAYYAVYSKTQPFIEMAARTLYREVTPVGILPVSVSSIGYDLIVATTPDPDQVIPLMVVTNSEGEGDTQSSSVSTAQTLVINAGDNLPLQTGIIKDQNGNPVPDGTVVRFIIDTQSTSGSIEQIEAQTKDGIAKTVYRIPESGVIKLRVTADPATISTILQIEITSAGGTLTSIDPTFSPTGETASPEPTSTSPILPPVIESNHVRGLPGFVDWILATMAICFVCVAIYRYGSLSKKKLWNPLLPFGSGLGGYIFYLLPIMGLTIAQKGVQQNGTLFIIGLTLLGSFIGFGLGYLVRIFQRSEKLP